MQTSSRSLNQLQIHANPQFCSDNPWSILASNEEDFQEPTKTHLFIQQCNERRTPTLTGPRSNPPFLSLKSPEKSRYLKEPDADMEERLNKLEQLFIQSWDDLLASFKKLAPSPELKLLT